MSSGNSRTRWILCIVEALDPEGFQPFPVLWEQPVLDTDVVLGGRTLDSEGDCRDVSRALKDRLCIFSIDFFFYFCFLIYCNL